MAEKKEFTLVYIFDKEGRVLLGLKKRGFGRGLWNGFGGKIQTNERPKDCAIREVFEECGLVVKDINYAGFIRFDFKDDPVFFEQHIYTAFDFSGSVIESDEMAPKWFEIKALPYDQMWLDQIHWHEHLFKGQTFKARFLLQGFEKVLNCDITTE